MPHGTKWMIALAVLIGFVSWGFAVSSAVAQTGTKPSEADLAAGKKLYDERCMHCHGEEGDGGGWATPFVMPKPRDFTFGTYKFRTRHETPDGNRLPSDEDIYRSIAEGLHGSSMPGWEGFFTGQQIWQLVHYIKTFSELFEEDKPGPMLDVGGDIASSADSIAKGKQYFEEEFDCVSCHGAAGRGNGQQALDGLEDDWGSRIWPANLTRPWTYRGGHARRDIFRNISLGINGTPMPAFADPDPMAEARETDDAEEKKELESQARELREKIWHVVNYVQSLWTHAEEPQVKAVLTAYRVTGPLPQSPDDPAWKTVASNYYPVVGQVIEAPRLFASMIVGVEIQALHNDDEIAFRVLWDDRTQSKEGEAENAETYLDAVALQFPSHAPEGSERPYFLMGDADNPTDLWYWRGDASPAVRVQTTGYKTFKPGEETGGVQSQGLFDNGQYRLVMRRALRTEQADAETQFQIGRFSPISVTVWDGSNGEHGGSKRAVSAWYNLYIEPEPSKAPMLLWVVGVVFGFCVMGVAVYVTRQR